MSGNHGVVDSRSGTDEARERGRSHAVRLVSFAALENGIGGAVNVGERLPAGGERSFSVR